MFLATPMVSSCRKLSDGCTDRPSMKNACSPQAFLSIVPPSLHPDAPQTSSATGSKDVDCAGLSFRPWSPACYAISKPSAVGTQLGSWQFGDADFQRNLNIEAQPAGGDVNRGSWFAVRVPQHPSVCRRMSGRCLWTARVKAGMTSPALPLPSTAYRAVIKPDGALEDSKPQHPPAAVSGRSSWHLRSSSPNRSSNLAQPARQCLQPFRPMSPAKPMNVEFGVGSTGACTPVSNPVSSARGSKVRGWQLSGKSRNTS